MSGVSGLGPRRSRTRKPVLVGRSASSAFICVTCARLTRIDPGEGLLGTAGQPYGGVDR